jgi:hypothetical protein
MNRSLILTIALLAAMALAGTAVLAKTIDCTGGICPSSSVLDATRRPSPSTSWGRCWRFPAVSSRARRASRVGSGGSTFIPTIWPVRSSPGAPAA